MLQKNDDVVLLTLCFVCKLKLKKTTLNKPDVIFFSLILFFILKVLVFSLKKKYEKKLEMNNADVIILGMVKKFILLWHSATFENGTNFIPSNSLEEKYTVENKYF